jgi:hypothetical protein
MYIKLFYAISAIILISLTLAVWLALVSLSGVWLAFIDACTA